jgi:hypothetical protein
MSVVSAALESGALEDRKYRTLMADPLMAAGHPARSFGWFPRAQSVADRDGR